MSQLVFPETVARLPTSRRPLQLKTVLAIVYAFGGLAAAVALLAKFVTGPLFEQLSYDRSVYAQAARRRLYNLNVRISGLVSHSPSARAIAGGYVDARTQTEGPTSGRKAAHESAEEQDWSAFSQLFKSITGPVGPDGFDAESERVVGDKVDTFTTYLRTLMYTTPSYQWKYATVKGMPEDMLGDVKKEISAFKGALLSS